ncbi:putative N-acetyltransferase YjaB [Tritonibacter multivorans]|uniref:Putative N-acetyltransferase YjaB n=1 Tax=Tritonibacter multivorans TaxID=928856 RepID=A0A0P1GH54_9RHOB|nr:GNAT family N-acetyltransferase [Tritonibacter multivorans]MDA7419526.1 GNAT family N-acetyltransferase [Tritonibacter multivorans]CUH75638.1 putative N-acetyltransferase YjaB [Tritonibacter multivorans]SFC63746.1 Acetyltransferase (GNAT) domain-containing protein [Tritonibacter multivorans]
MTLYLRNAQPTDAGKLGAILHRFEVDTPWMPKTHCEAEAIAFCGTMIDRGWVTVALTDRVVGFLARDGGQICSLYVHPDMQGQGIGKALLDNAKSTEGELMLWTFQANEGAQRFYLREGFVEKRRTEGDNDEGLPDILYRWTIAQELQMKEALAQEDDA